MIHDENQRIKHDIARMVRSRKTSVAQRKSHAYVYSQHQRGRCEPPSLLGDSVIWLLVPNASSCFKIPGLKIARKETSKHGQPLQSPQDLEQEPRSLQHSPLSQPSGMIDFFNDAVLSSQHHPNPCPSCVAVASLYYSGSGNTMRDFSIPSIPYLMVTPESTPFEHIMSIFMGFTLCGINLSSCWTSVSAPSWCAVCNATVRGPSRIIIGVESSPWRKGR